MVRFFRSLLILGLILVVALFVMTFRDYQQVQHENTLLQQPQLLAEANINTKSPLRLQFHKAAYLQRTGDQQQALELYKNIENYSHRQHQKTLWRDAKFNIGLIYLSHAINAKNAASKQDREQWQALAELAHSEFKDITLALPEDYPARLSLEQAISILPEEIQVKSDWKEQRSSVWANVAGIAKGGP